MNTEGNLQQATRTPKSSIDLIKSKNCIADAISFLAVLIFLVQIWIYASNRKSSLDEGAYLYKGFLFVSGQYRIYQEYGPWSNHMPFSFLIPGIIQYIFGPGLGPGRYFSIVLALLGLLGLWIVASRIGNRWWAAAALLAVSLNPAIIKIYSVAVPQVLVMCMLIWIFVLTLGKNRPTWQIVLGTLLAALLLLTRLNMFLVLPYILIYIFWQHGKKTGSLCLILGAAVVIAVHTIYWPGIMTMWARQLPQEISPFLDSWRYAGEVVNIWNPDVSMFNRILSFLISLRIHFIPLVGVLISILMWPKKSEWKDMEAFRISVILLVLFLSLWGIHLWSALGQNYCVFCLDGYLAYFSLIGLLLVISSFSSWRKQFPIWIQVILAILIILLFTGVGLGSFENTGELLLNIQIPRAVIAFPEYSPGSVTLDKVLINKFSFDYPILRRIVPTFFGMLIGILILITSIFIWLILSRRRKDAPEGDTYYAPSYIYTALLVTLAMGFVLSPSVLLGGGISAYDCTGNTIDSYKEAGQYLAEKIPPGSKVYWHGGLSPVTMLYIPGIDIYPAQLNDGYSFKLEGNSDLLMRKGLWNKELALQWIDEADFVLIEDRSYSGWHKEAILSGNFDELNPTPLQVTCQPDSWIHVFQNNN
jgi:hypothetical protein